MRNSNAVSDSQNYAPNFLSKKALAKGICLFDNAARKVDRMNEFFKKPM